MFKAWVIEKDDAGYRAALREREDDALPEGEVTVDVAYSTLNYKDALALTGAGPVVRRFPLHAGIDFAGRVRDSRDPRFAPGDRVLANGHGMGETHPGGLAQRVRVSADWLQRLPPGIDERQAMAIGTAGYTAMLCVQALERHGCRPGDGEILVTGASGGVGSIAVALLKGAGHRVVASTGKASQAQWLRDLGAAEVIGRETLSAPGKPLARERWSGAIDAVGSHTLANACASTRYGGAVAACGLAQGMDFPASVAPFILRGITLYGIDSVMAPMPRRVAAWTGLAERLDRALLASLTQEIGMDDVPRMAAELLGGRISGRVVVDVNR